MCLRCVTYALLSLSIHVCLWLLLSFAFLVSLFASFVTVVLWFVRSFFGWCPSFVRWFVHSFVLCFSRSGVSSFLFRPLCGLCFNSDMSVFSVYICRLIFRSLGQFSVLMLLFPFVMPVFLWLALSLLFVGPLSFSRYSYIAVALQPQNLKSLVP